LTTHYLEEAEDCDDVAFLANGRLIGGGRPSELVERLGRHMLEIEDENLDSVVSMLEPKLGPCLREEGRVLFRIQDRHFDLKNALGASVETLQSVRQRRPNLNDVFLWVNHPELAEAVAA
jgi:ABC-2 type transport system ATP-binding protein